MVLVDFALIESLSEVIVFFHSLNYFYFRIGKHHDKLPKSEEINKDVLPLLFEAVTVNANYTSKIEVRRILLNRNSKF